MCSCCKASCGQVLLNHSTRLFSRQTYACRNAYKCAGQAAYKAMLLSGMLWEGPQPCTATVVIKKKNALCQARHQETPLVCKARRRKQHACRDAAQHVKSFVLQPQTTHLRGCLIEYPKSRVNFAAHSRKGKSCVVLTS